jgi:hypothetical protein
MDGMHQAAPTERAKTDRELTDEVLDELRKGNWPDCQHCRRRDKLQYIGIVAHVPTFFCARCSFAMGLDLRDA